MRTQASCCLVRRSLDWDLSAAEVLRMVRSDAHPVALLGAWAGGGDIVASDPVRICQDPDEPFSGDLAGLAGDAGFGGGWIGYLGFGVAGDLLPVPPAPGEPRRLPACWFGYYDHVLRRDRASGQWSFEALVTPDREGAPERRLSQLSRRAQAARPEPRAYHCSDFRLIPSPDEHMSAVRQTVSCIRRGDLF
jgi:para-aminobenzoate synthetase / 4-amino-4-deoxychorismate lyase